MNATGILLSTAVSFLFLFLLFRPLELFFPAKKKQKFLRPAFWTDLFFFFGQYILWNGLVFAAIQWGGGWLTQWIPEAFRESVRTQPLWLQITEVILLTDLLIYWGHRLQHRIPFLWCFHSIHHSAEHLDWLAANREHPLDTIYTVTLVNLPVFLLGFPLELLAGFIGFRGLWAVFIHSNVRLPIGPLRWFIGAPELHHWHHDKDRLAGNYANLSPLMDLLFGTYRCPDHEPEAFGISEPIAQTYWGQLWHPFRRKPAADLK